MTDIEQVRQQCRVVIHLARALADVNEDYAERLPDEVLNGIEEAVGKRTAHVMEVLGDILNGMDAVDGEEDAWTTQIFAAAQARWPQPPHPADEITTLRAQLAAVTAERDALRSVVACYGEMMEETDGVGAVDWDIILSNARLIDEPCGEWTDLGRRVMGLGDAP